MQYWIICSIRNNLSLSTACGSASPGLFAFDNAWEGTVKTGPEIFLPTPNVGNGLGAPNQIVGYPHRKMLYARYYLPGNVKNSTILVRKNHVRLRKLSCTEVSHHNSAGCLSSSLRGKEIRLRAAARNLQTEQPAAAAL